MIILGYLLIGCFVDIAILLHDLVFCRDSNEAYTYAYAKAIKTQLLNFIRFALLWPILIVSLVMYYTNAKYRAEVDEYSRQKRSKGE